MWQTPSFWYEAKKPSDRLWPVLLTPLAFLYGWLARKRFDLYFPVPLARPVICVGNLVAGGAGKTPVVLSLVGLLQDKGYNPHLLTRGYGGEEEGPLQVSPDRDTAEDVGDEALLLVEKAPTWVARSRPQGAQAAIDTGASVIIMDDGFQNPSLYKDFVLLVVDGTSGFGNGKIFPAGPLREPLAFGLSRAHAVLIIGEDKADVARQVQEHTAVPVLSARLEACPDNPEIFSKTVYAFAGLGRPQKFKETLEAAGAIVEGWAEFPDHYPYAEEDLKELVAAAEAKNCPVITTAKDYVRLPETLRKKVLKFSVRLVWKDEEEVLRLALEALQKRAP